MSGKTTLLAMMNAHCNSWGWTILPANDETLDYTEYVTGFLLEQMKLPRPTEVATPLIHRYVLQKSEDNKSKRVTVEMPDAAGEIYVDPEHEVFNMIEYLNGCDGIMWLLDPVALTKNTVYGWGTRSRSYRQIIYRTLNRMFQTKYMDKPRIDKYMAFVLTKMDHADHNEHFDDPRNYALRLLGKQTRRVIEDTCDLDRVEFFSVSALGFADKACTISNLDDSDPTKPTFRTKDINPIGVFDPLNWLLGKLT